MSPSRETIYAALFQRMSGVPGIVTAGRRLKHWSEIPAAMQPALFQVQRAEEAMNRKGLPAAYRLSLDLYLYAATSGDPAIAPAQILNPLLDAIEAALGPDPVTGVQNLGGIVQHAWIEGKIETDEGALGDQAVAIIPVEILVP